MRTELFGGRGVRIREGLLYMVMQRPPVSFANRFGHKTGIYSFVDFD